MRLILLSLFATSLLAQNGLNATNMTDNAIRLDWVASSGMSQYLIERCAGKNCTNFAQVATASTVSYVDSGLDHYTYYMYRVRATDGTNFSPYGRVAGVSTVDLVLQSTSGDRCTAVTSLSSAPLVTFTCNQGSQSGLPGLRATTTVNNVNPVFNGIGVAWLGLSATITCMLAINEDPNTAGNAVFGQHIIPGNPPTSTPILTPLPPSAIGYSCSVDGVSPIIQGVWSLAPASVPVPTLSVVAPRKSLISRMVKKIRGVF